MTIDSIREFCLSMKEATEGMPFGEEALVFKVKNKMFALLSLDSQWLNVKCDPENAIAIREEYPSVTPGYHMSKKHWNTIQLDGSISEKKIKEWITDSYKLVVSGLPLKLQKELK
jgi:predicted DNA-binding protein (MmcQ/YjbR family)